MTTIDLVKLFGKSAGSPEVQELFLELNTMRRPSLPESPEEHVYHDWVLVRRKGIELGFSDSEYHRAAPRDRWGQGELLLTQAYFYSGFDDLKPFKGELPYGLTFADTPERAREKLSQFTSSFHSWISDSWDVPAFRLSIAYTEDRRGIDRIACRQPAASIRNKGTVQWPCLSDIISTFGHTVSDATLIDLWAPHLDAHALKQATEDDEIDFTQSFGATISVVGNCVRSVTLHRNRDMESVGWNGELPFGLDFEDSPSSLFEKVPGSPVQQSDSILTGHGVWHFPDFTLHVLYSNIDNRILRVKLIAPGTWKCVEEE